MASHALVVSPLALVLSFMVFIMVFSWLGHLVCAMLCVNLTPS